MKWLLGAGVLALLAVIVEDAENGPKKSKKEAVAVETPTPPPKGDTK